MSVEEFLGGVRVLQPSAENLRDPPLWMFLTPSLTDHHGDHPYHLNTIQNKPPDPFDDPDYTTNPAENLIGLYKIIQEKTKLSVRNL